ncbi:hypothetical protein [Methanococcoides methylutens]|nr:hypothetical protein [Methanococcoides methylutens]
MPGYLVIRTITVKGEFYKGGINCDHLFYDGVVSSVLMENKLLCYALLQ